MFLINNMMIINCDNYTVGFDKTAMYVYDEIGELSILIKPQENKVHS